MICTTLYILNFHLQNKNKKQNKTKKLSIKQNLFNDVINQKFEIHMYTTDLKRK